MTSRNPFFSVVVPVYNVADYLDECIESVLSQSFHDFECILIDDGSTDGSSQICDRYSMNDDRVTVVHQPNGGLSNARNSGIAAASGKYLLFLDGDDYYLSLEAFSEVKKIVDREEANIICLGFAKYYGEKDKYRLYPRAGVDNLPGKTSGEVFLEQVASGDLQISAWSLAVERSFLLDNKLLFKEGIKSEDVEWAMRLFSASPSWSFQKEPVYAYRQNRTGSITSNVGFGHCCDLLETVKASIALAEQCDDQTCEAIKNYMTYQLLVIIADTRCSDMSASEKRHLLAEAETLVRCLLPDYHKHPNVSKAAPVYKLFGFDMMAFALGLYLKYR